MPRTGCEPNGRWDGGELEVERERGGVWSGWVRSSTGVAETRVDWFDEEAVRRLR